MECTVDPGARPAPGPGSAPGGDPAAIVAALAARHPLFARATIERWVAEEVERYDPAPVRTFVPVLVQRSVEARLMALSDERHPQGEAGRITALEPRRADG